MISITVAALRQNVSQVIDYANESRVPIAITNDKGKGAVLIGEDEWAAVEETLHLTGIPGVAKSLQIGMNEPVENCFDESQVW